MSVTKESVDRLMKRCQIGCGGRKALDDAHDILAECYGTLGALFCELVEARHERDEARSGLNVLLAQYDGIEAECNAMDAVEDERDALLGANYNLVRWKGEIDQRRILLNLPFPDDYDNSPRYAVTSLIEAETAALRARIDGAYYRIVGADGHMYPAPQELIGKHVALVVLND